MTYEKDKETMYIKNIVDYSDYKPNNQSLNVDKNFHDYMSFKSNSDYNSHSIDEKIINILNFEEEINDLEYGSFDDGSFDDGSFDDGSFDDGSFDDGSFDDSNGLDDGLGECDFGEENEFICSLGINPKDDTVGGMDIDSLTDNFNQVFLDNCDELAFLSFFDDFVLVEMGFDDMIKEVYFEE